MAIPFARRIYNWSNMLEGWEGRHAFIWCDFHRVGHGYIVSLVSGWPRSLYIEERRIYVKCGMRVQE